ncbi:LANO_0H22298g1_1 [Lachancea nothofagi CBS 11611]|uniref:LANO_0H22298g1_1 n=1 Tax=Lachancea nothofagi CBS 11611 TaxID=1266666 RepID=A0A1G4KNP7_9SACH|nr:LANO_0H22298g1_1 [Lachancea nothofagi CBS 11611]
MSAVLKRCTATATLNTGARIPLLGLGTWRSSKDNGYKAVLKAIEAGYRHIDSAAVCMNEQVIGRAIRDSQVPREELFVTTKLWSTQHRNPAGALEQSLQRLGLDYVDLFMMHWPLAFKTDRLKTKNVMIIPMDADKKPDVDTEWDHVKTWELMQQLPARGTTKAIGVSNCSIAHLQKILDSPENKIVPATNQIEAHPFLPQDEMLNFCRGKGILMEGYSPLGSDGAPFIDEPVIREIAKRYHVEPAQVLINWGLKRGYAVLPKSKTPERIVSNLQQFELSNEDFNRIHELAQERGPKRTHNPPWFSFD